MSEFICVCCPTGCRVCVQADSASGELVISGNECARGRAYAEAEMTNPVRMLTMTMPVAGALEPLSVKTSAPVPKALLGACAREIASLELAAPVVAGDVVLQNVCDIGVSVVATKTVLSL